MNTNQQRKERIFKLLQSGGAEKDLEILDAIFALEDKLDAELPGVRNLIERVRGEQGIDGPQGKKGDKGDRGEQGEPGPDGKTGRDGRDGQDGRDGLDGRDGKAGEDGSPDSGEDIIEKINQLSDDAVKIKASRIENLPHLVRSIYHQSGFHLGGFETPIKAGAGVSVTKDALGNWVVSASVTSAGYQVATGTVNGSNQIFTFSTAPNVLVVDGLTIRQTAADGTVMWTGTTTITLTVAPNFEIYGVA